MRIAIFSEVFLPKVDGITNRLRHTIEEFADQKDEVLIFAPSQAVDELSGYRVVKIASWPFPPYPEVRMSWPSPKIFNQLRKFKPDVVHIVGPACLGVWGTLYAKLLGIPIVASYHTDFPKYMPLYRLGRLVKYAWRLIRRLHNQATINLCPSQHTRYELLQHGIHNVDLWRGGVDTKRFHPDKRSRAVRKYLTQGRPQKKIFLYVGRISHEKGIAKLKSLVEKIPEAQLVLVGDGPARGDLQEHFRGTSTVFTGYLRGDQLAKVFASADVFVMPSETETLGFVTLEAMSSGLPVIAADAGGTKDIVKHGVSGFLYDPQQCEKQLVEYAEKLLSDSSLHRAFAHRGRGVAVQSDWKEQTHILKNWYQRCIDLHRRGPIACDFSVSKASLS